MSRPIAMISSTARDLPEHRERVRKACERIGFAPEEMMEHLTALDKDAVEISLEMVDRADVYIGIFAHRYGSIPDGADKSITEMEYDRAVEKKIPRLIFFINEDLPVLPKDFDTGPGAAKLQALKERIGKERVAAFFETAADLHGHAIAALQKFREEREEADGEAATDRAAAVIHRHSAIPTPPTADIVHPYTLSETHSLIGRQKELATLTDWVSKSNAKIFCLVAIGGMGKSALAWKWFQEIAPKEMPELEGRLWWSFYESDASFENFLNRALGYVGGLHEDEIRKMDWQDREALLLRHLDEKPFLLGLDGLERILLAYCRMDASHLADDDLDQKTANRVAGAYGLPETAGQSFVGQHQLRRTTDPRAGHFLQKLASVRASRTLVSTRLYPSALQTRSGRPSPGCIAYFLEGLSGDDALELWRALGVSGKRAELLPLFDSFERHPLLLQALAGEVATYRRKPGDFAAWKKAYPDFDPTELPLEQRRSHILQYALQRLDGPVREVLHTITGFRMPAHYQTLEALLIGEDKACPDAQALDRALSELEDRGLIGWDREANRYDAHPIVRGVIWQVASGDARDSIHAAIDAHFEPMAVPEWKQVESLADLTPAIERYHTLVERGQLDRASDLFYDRLANATFYRLAAHRQSISMLERLFPDGTDKPPALKSEQDQAWALNALAMSYALSGRPGNAVMLYQKLETICERLGDKASLQPGLENLAYSQWTAGALRDAEGAIRQAFALSRELESRFAEATSLEELGRVAATTHDHELARFALTRSAMIFQIGGDRHREGTVSATHAELSLWQDDITTAGRYADRAWRLANFLRQDLDFSRAAFLQGLIALRRGMKEQADERLHYALARTRAVNVVSFELPTLIAIAELELARGKTRAARDHLDEVWEPAEEGPYPLYQADAYNVLADICLAGGDKPGAIEAATKAYRAAWCDGPPWAYHWGLEKAKAHLQALGAPEPDMPPFDESNYEPLPEVEINPKDEYWVDPDQPLEALLDLNDGN